MNDQLEPLLRETLDDLAGEAPVAGDLAGTARGRLRRRRQRLAGGTAALAVVVLAAGMAVWGGPRAGTSGPPAGEVRVEPAPAASVPYCPGGNGDCPDARAVDALRQRALHLPVVRPGDECPISPARTLPEGGGFKGDYLAVGNGPFRMVGNGVVWFEYPPGPDTGSYNGSGWGGEKVIWSIDASYSGPVLLRGAQIDGTAELRFDRYIGALGQTESSAAFEELAYPALPGGNVVRTPPSAVRLQRGGCYAIQVDGTSFSEIIVFRAEQLGR
jgi:hypothetical protein